MAPSVFLEKDQVWQRRVVIGWSLFAGLAVLWDFSWCFVFKDLQTVGTQRDWRLFWTIYAMADNRYLQGDRYLLVLEFVTGLGSILNFYVVRQLLRGTPERARLALFAISIMEIYGTVMYLGSEALNHFANIDTSSFVHTWVMFVGLNSLWLVFPGWCIFELVAHRPEALASAAAPTRGQIHATSARPARGMRVVS